MRLACVGFILLFLIVSLPAAAEDETGSIQDKKRELQAVEEKKDAAEEKVRKSEKKEKTILGDLEALDREIGRTSRRIGNLRRDEQDLMVRISRTEENLSRITRERELARERLMVRSTALYKAGNVSYLKVILGSNGIEDLEHRLFYLKKIAEQDSALFNQAAVLFNREKQEQDRLLAESNRLKSTRQDLEKNLSTLARRKQSRDILLASTRNEKEKYTRLIKELEVSSARLIKLIDALSRQIETGDSAFPMLKGALKSPVSGKIVVDFGKNRNARFNTYTLSSGITIRSAEGTPVRSVFKGKTLFADWFRGYGRIIILDHGSGYYTLYGHLSAIHVEVGQEIDTDELIGLAGDSGSLEGPALYFEIRHHGKPVDPRPWLMNIREAG
ncbi:hypothetical protein EP232_04515 [bacterium]|nr:MAG: hypothetical protein EP232_04515 [bacterium]